VTGLTLLRVILALLGLGIGFLMVYLVRRDRLHGIHAVWWIAVSTCVIVFGMFPRVIDWIGTLLGVSYPPILLVIVTLLLVLVKLLTIDLDRTRHDRKLRYLAQRIAILEHEVKHPRHD